MTTTKSPREELEEALARMCHRARYSLDGDTAEHWRLELMAMVKLGFEAARKGDPYSGTYGMWSKYITAADFLKELEPK